MSGIVNLSQPWLDMASVKIWHSNPIPINIVLATLGTAIGGTLVGYVWMQTRCMEQEREASTSKMDQYNTIREEDESECISFLDLRTA